MHPLSPSCRSPRVPCGSRAQALLTAAAIAVVVASLPAQVPPGLQFAELGKRHLPADADNTQAVAHGDVDGDGDLDLVVGNDGQNRIYLNNGSGIFTDATASRMPVDNDWTEAVALGDVDGDGDLDLVMGNYYQQSRLYRNNGAGTFVDATTSHMPVGALHTTAVALGDVDGDGDLDMVLGNTRNFLGTDGQDRLYLNNGTGTFTDATASRMPVVLDNTSSVALGDVDSDGDLDLVIGNWEQDRLYLNNGTGTFTDATASRMPVVLDSTSSVALGDVDSDGDLDLVIGNWGYLTGLSSRLCLNNGTGIFTDATNQLPVGYPATSAIALGDVDGDGDLDLVIGNSFEQSRLYLNNGVGTFSDATAARMPVLNGNTSSLMVGDVDSDGDADLVIGNSGQQNRLYLNNGTGTFTDATAGPLPVALGGRRIATGDVDNDGYPDLVVGGNGHPMGLLRHNGNSTFTDVSALQLPSTSDEFTATFALGDVDGDGDLDVVVGNRRSFFPYGQDLLYLNNGSGHFTDATLGRMPFDADDAMSIVLGDVDGDGDLDILIGNWLQQNRLYRNDGAGTFTDITASHMPVDADSTNSLLLGDLDGDGDLDVIVENRAHPDRLYRNDGQGHFTHDLVWQLPPSGFINALALGDIDQDGDLDLVAGCGDPAYWSGRQDQLLLNDGTGTFANVTATHLPNDSDVTVAVTFGDIDGDGDLDLVSGNQWNTYYNSATGADRLYLNDGAGLFTATATQRLPSGDTDTQALGDLDGDGDLDLVNGRSARPVGMGNPGSFTVWWNLQHQLNAPYLLRPGRPFTLEAYSRYATPSAFDTALTYLSTERQSIPVPPHGVLGIDPMLALLPIFIPQPSGIGGTTWNVPNNPALAGIEIFAQAAIVHWPADIRLTNVTADVILR